MKTYIFREGNETFTSECKSKLAAEFAAEMWNATLLGEVVEGKYVYYNK